MSEDRPRRASGFGYRDERERRPSDARIRGEACLLQRVKPAFNVFAYNKDDEHLTTDLRRDEIPQWNLTKAIEWALHHGMDTILIERTPNPALGVPWLTHHFECSDSKCPGGC